MSKHTSGSEAALPMRLCSLLRNAGTGIERDLERLGFTSAISANAVAQINTIERATVAVVKRQNPRATASLGPKQVVIEMGGSIVWKSQMSPELRRSVKW